MNLPLVLYWKTTENSWIELGHRTTGKDGIASIKLFDTNAQSGDSFSYVYHPGKDDTSFTIGACIITVLIAHAS